MRVNKVCLSAICAVAISAVNVSAVDLDTISVESSTIADTAVDQKTEASTVNVITEKEITEIDPKNINDLLETIPGVTADVRSDVVEIHIRGVAQQEFMWEDTGVTVVIDGVPVMQDGGKVRGINIDDIASIKVIKGGASYLYGENSLAGAIIITTKKNKDKNGGYIKAEQGNYGYENYKLKLYRSADKYSANILASYKYEDGYWWETQNDAKTLSGLFTYYIDDSSDVAIGADYLDKYQETTRGSVTGVTEAEENPTGEDD
ncbi:MAG: TonB-dependent receptor plug domain-containing protein, partial [Epsilonproteobacteria bacterium]|nr:TonB-dependent receptor plug domain-containing protein [Campylobacterota bacterium]